ncbi:MAG: hypothetical protein JRJ85_26485, partial [Deltaproteobacteria bacterium]|nr:hypothetical protein [Deltaproteobacteria bacterium]
QILLTDDTTTLSIDNVTWMQDANYSLTKGTLYVDGDWNISGDGTTFAYSTSQTSDIKSNAHMIFDEGVTFSYDNSTATLIAMEDSAAAIHFKGGNLLATDDVRFQKGRLIFSDLVNVTKATGKKVYIGDNSDPGNNVTLDFHEDSEVTFEDDETLENQNV